MDLFEINRNSRIFTGIVGLSIDALSNYGLLYVNSGPPSTTASFVYNDPTGGSRTALSRLQFSGVVSVAFPGQSQGLTSIRVGDTITVTVTDGDADLNPLQIGEVQVTVSSLDDYTEVLTLL